MLHSCILHHCWIDVGKIINTRYQDDPLVAESVIWPEERLLGRYVTAQGIFHTTAKTVVDHNSVFVFCFFITGGRKWDLFPFRKSIAWFLTVVPQRQKKLICYVTGTLPIPTPWCDARLRLWDTSLKTWCVCFLQPARSFCYSEAFSRSTNDHYKRSQMGTLSCWPGRSQWPLFGQSDCLDSQLACHVCYITGEDAEKFSHLCIFSLNLTKEETSEWPKLSQHHFQPGNDV